jgi:N-acetylglucosamine-6-sulfatase
LPARAVATTLVLVSLRSQKLWFLAALIAVVALIHFAIIGAESKGHGRAHGAGGRVIRGPKTPVAHPNFLVITTDDQTLSQFNRTAMPFTWRFFRRAGSVFTNSLSVPPLCCPDRAGFLTGEYAHNHGVLTNDSGYSYLRQKDNILPVWLGRAGYRTGLVGKYLNGYPALGPTPAPGWDEFFAAGGLIVDYRDFDVGINGKPRHYGGRHYSTPVYTHDAERFIHGTATEGRPFFLWLTYNAPHTVPDGSPPCPGVRAQPEFRADYQRFAHASLPQSPALGERDVRDKGRWVRDKPPISGRRLAVVQRNWRCALSALPPVDRGVRSIVGELRRLGERDRTNIVFTSDNGYFYGEHRIPDDKKLPYDPALRVPLAISVPPGIGGVTPPPQINSLVSNVDLAPTLLDYSHARPCKNPDRCRTIDGHSLRPLLEGQTPAWTKNRAIPIELDEDFTYKALRTPSLLYMKLTADRLGPLPHPEIELYDLRSDPFELQNLRAKHASSSRQLWRRLSARLRNLTHCTGTRGPQRCP